MKHSFYKVASRLLLSCIAGITLLELASCRRITESLQELQAEIEAEIDAEIQAELQNMLPANSVEDLLATIDTVLDEPSDPISPEFAITDIEPIRTACKNALKSGQYTILEKELDQLVHHPAFSQDGYHIYTKVMAGLTVAENVQGWLEHSDSTHARAIHIRREVNMAWDARGSGYASKVTEEGWQKFTEHLANARTSLINILDEDPDNSAALYFGTSVILGQGWSEKDWRSYMEHTQQNRVLDPMVPYKLTSYLTSRWHGSTQDMANFFKEDLNTWPDGAGKFRAMLYGLDKEIDTYGQQEVLKKPKTRKIFSKMIARYRAAWPEGTDITWRVVALYLDAELYQEALEFCDIYLKKNPENLTLYHSRGTALRKLDRKEEALENYLEAHKLNPTSTLFNYHISWYYGRVKQFQQAEPYALQALKGYSSKSKFYREKCLGYVAHAAFERSEYQRVIELSREAISLYDDHASTWHLYAAAHYHTGDTVEAKKAWKTTIKLDKKYIQFLKQHYPDWNK